MKFNSHIYHLRAFTHQFPWANLCTKTITTFPCLVTADRVLEAAAEILVARSSKPTDSFCNPTVTKSYAACKLQAYEREVFAVMLLDNQHRAPNFN